MKNNNLNMDKLMRYLLDGNEFKYRYVYENLTGVCVKQKYHYLPMKPI